MRQPSRSHEGSRAAIWTETRRRLAVAAIAAPGLASLVLALPPAGPAATSATVPTSLLDAAEARPNDPFKVVIQGPAGVSSDELGTVFGRVKSSDPAPASKLRRKFKLIDGIAVTLTGKQILKLAGMRLIGS